MIIREYSSADCGEIAELFYNTVHTVNAADYTKEQLDAWDRSFREHFSLVALEGSTIVGFGDIDKTAYLDRLYVHAHHQREGIAAAICDRLEEAVQGNILVHASITARPFFEKRGYRVIKEQKVERQGVLLTNFVMEKER